MNVMDKDKDKDKWMNTREAAEYMGWSKRTLYRRLNKRRIAFLKLEDTNGAGSIRVLKSALDAYLERYGTNFPTADDLLEKLDDEQGALFKGGE